MNRNRLYIVLFVFGWGIFSLLNHACKSKTQEIPPIINVNLQVKDEATKQPVDSSAVAYLYNSQQAFNNAYQNSLNLVYNSNGSILTANVVNGQVTLNNLPSNTNYWILVHDTSTVFMNGNVSTGIKIDKDNSGGYYTITGFQNGTIVDATVYVTPVTSLIKLTTTAGTLPTNIIFNNGSPVVLSTSGYKKVRVGTVGYQARTNTCVWTGNIDAVGGQVVTENLGNCNSQLVTFYPPSDLQTGEIIKIYIGQNKNETKNPDVLLNSNASQTIVLAAGTNYSYFAESTVRNCVWEGAVSLNNYLSDCQ